MLAQTYLEQNGGAGLQHLALKTDDVFATLREMRARTDQGGFDFMPCASPDYYRRAAPRGTLICSCYVMQCAGSAVHTHKTESSLGCVRFMQILGCCWRIPLTLVQGARALVQGAFRPL